MEQRRLYVAYGSNLNLQQMGWRCPTAKVVGIGKIENYQLLFNGVATIVPEEKASVPVAVWEIQPKDEQALDRYEGYPSYYRKEDIKVKMENGEEITAMVYIMNRGKPSLPSHSYFETIRQGYADVGLALADLMKALEYTDLRR